jgi:hypothetical protein
MLQTATGAPAATCSPGATGSATTSAGAGARTTPPSSADPVHGAVHLDQMPGGVGRGDHPEVLPGDGEPGPELAQMLALGVQEVAVHPDPVPGRADPGDSEAVDRPAQLELEGAADLMPGLRAPTVRGGQEPQPLHLLLGLVGVDRRGHQGDPGVPVGDQAAGGAGPVDPAGVRGGLDHLPLVEQVEQERLVRRPAVDHHRGVCQRAAQPGQRLLSGGTDGDDLGDHRVEVGRNHITLGHPGVDPHPGPDRQPQQGDPPGGRGEVTVGVLGVEPGLDRVPGLGRGVALQLAARRDP